MRQARTAEVEQLLADDQAIVTWWGTPLECLSALVRLRRELTLNDQKVRAAEQRLMELRRSWVEILPSEACRRAAERMLRVHALRAADALQLSAALIAADHDTSCFCLLTLDKRLREAAGKEGFATALKA